MKYAMSDCGLKRISDKCFKMGRSDSILERIRG